VVFEPSVPFRVLGYRQAETNLDGTRNLNLYFVAVEVDGVVHDVGIGRSTGIARVPRDLNTHPLAATIEKAALQFVRQDLLVKLQI
jgi:hypothetical protein